MYEVHPSCKFEFTVYKHICCQKKKTGFVSHRQEEFSGNYFDLLYLNLQKFFIRIGNFYIFWDKFGQQIQSSGSLFFL